MNLEFTHILKTDAQKAFGILYKEHYKPLCWYALRFVDNATDAEDIVQNTLSSLWAKREALETVLHIKPYLYTAIKNACLNFLRDKKEMYRISELDIELLELSNDIEADDIVKYEKVCAFITQLPPQSRKIFQLHKLDGYSYKEIAEHLNISPKTVDSHLTTTMKKIKEHFNPIAMSVLISIFIN